MASLLFARNRPGAGAARVLVSAAVPRNTPERSVAWSVMGTRFVTLVLKTLTMMLLWPARSESASSIVTVSGRVYSSRSNAMVPMPSSPGMRNCMTRRRTVARRFPSGPVSGMVSSGKEKKATRPVLS